ncbi:hypothetical protein ACIGFL_11190 [Pseudomonas sp. NPDC077649]|uniref:hypothetical protein n=1 Tax=unclassified Pseudomonas TaxID=196821 RepID=UPI0011C3EBB4|nr:hypothetical protein [Pseudomonas sp. AOB-7]
MKLPFFTPGRMSPSQAAGETAPRQHGAARRRKASAAGDRMLCIYLAQNPGLTRRYMDLS